MYSKKLRTATAPPKTRQAISTSARCMSLSVGPLSCLREGEPDGASALGSRRAGLRSGAAGPANLRARRRGVNAGLAPLALAQHHRGGGIHRHPETDALQVDGRGRGAALQAG